MFEVKITHNDNTIDIYDGLEFMQAHCLYFCAMLTKTTARVEVNEFTV
jgi:hypothetical protein